VPDSKAKPNLVGQLLFIFYDRTLCSRPPNSHAWTFS